MTARDIDELFAQTLSGGYEDEASWQAVHTLRLAGTREVFERAAEWCNSNDPLARARGVDVLAQLGRSADHPSNNFSEESYALITALLQRETVARPLASAIAALGHLDNPLAVPLIAPFCSHPDPEVRFDVAFALGCFPDEALSTATLLHLTQDKEANVRDWAIFGLGVLGDRDSPEIRDVLFRCMSDSDEDVREEAMVGLGKRKDQRVLSALLSALQQPAMTDRVIEAAYLMLGMQNERQDWQGADYAAALREQFSL
ncbi:MAG: HEAT repeat domain-containing protein [Terriglobales bacterium]